MNTKLKILFICVLFLIQDSFASQFNAPVILGEGVELVVQNKLTNNSELFVTKTAKLDVFGEFNGAGTVHADGIIKIERPAGNDTSITIDGGVTNQIIVNSELTLKSNDDKVLVFGRSE